MRACFVFVCVIQSVYRMYDCKRGFRAVQDGFARSQARLEPTPHPSYK